jgi:hypothetical protein
MDENRLAVADTADDASRTGTSACGFTFFSDDRHLGRHGSPAASV